VNVKKGSRELNNMADFLKKSPYIVPSLPIPSPSSSFSILVPSIPSSFSLTSSSVHSDQKTVGDKRKQSRGRPPKTQKLNLHESSLADLSFLPDPVNFEGCSYQGRVKGEQRNNLGRLALDVGKQGAYGDDDEDYGELSKLAKTRVRKLSLQSSFGSAKESADSLKLQQLERRIILPPGFEGSSASSGTQPDADVFDNFDDQLHDSAGSDEDSDIDSCDDVEILNEGARVENNKISRKVYNKTLYNGIRSKSLEERIRDLEIASGRQLNAAEFERENTLSNRRINNATKKEKERGISKAVPTGPNEGPGSRGGAGSRGPNKVGSTGSRGGKGSRGPYKNQNIQSIDQGEEILEISLPSSESAVGSDGIKKSYKRSADIHDNEVELFNKEKKAIKGLSQPNLTSASISISSCQVVDSNSRSKTSKIAIADEQKSISREVISRREEGDSLRKNHANFEANENRSDRLSTSSNERQVVKYTDIQAQDKGETISGTSSDNNGDQKKKAGNYWNDQRSTNSDMEPDMYCNNDNDSNNCDGSGNTRQKVLSRSRLKRVRFSDSLPLSFTEHGLKWDQRAPAIKGSIFPAGSQVDRKHIRVFIPIYTYMYIYLYIFVNLYINIYI
jgi:hypothetical protein